MSTENDKIRHRVLKHYAAFTRDVDPDLLSDYLKQESIISIEQWQEICSKNIGSRLRCRALLDFLRTGNDPRAFLVVRDFLRKTNHRLSDYLTEGEGNLNPNKQFLLAEKSNETDLLRKEIENEKSVKQSLQSTIEQQRINAKREEQTLKEELKKEKANYKEHVEKLKQELDNNRITINELQVSNDKLKKELDEEKATNNSLQANNRKLVEELERCKATLKTAETNAEKVRKELETRKSGHEAPKKLQQALISPTLVKQLRSNILQKMKSFRFPNVSITNCIFENEYVEFYFVLEGIPSIDESLLVSEVVSCLGVDASFAESIKVTQLKSKPTGERTHFGPGNIIININARSMTTLGAFVSIGGKGDHVLSCGHDKTVGDILSNDNNERIGAIRAVACCVEDGQSYDAALANVDNIDYTKSVSYEGRQLHLAPTPVDPVKGTVVQRFPPRSYASQATIRHTDYNSFVHNIYGCFSVITDNRETFHRPGESGLVVTSVPSAEYPEIVDPFGMLFFREFVEKTDDGRGYFLSLAIPMTKNLEKLQEGEYCGRKQITF